MGSQFVDLNADGHLDLLTATFDGSPHVAYGSAEGLGDPVHLKDAEGRRIIISSIWNNEKKTHENLGRALPDGQARDERCISALAFDWDGDGDFDLLLGSYEGGRLYRQMNEGTNKQPKFTGKNIPVEAGGEPFELPAKMTTPRLVDWDGDGDLDLVAGTFGDSYRDRTGGGVYLSRNLGKKGAPRFGAVETLIPPSPKGQQGPTRPDGGLYADPVDWDGDGDLDLLVGAYSIWTPKQRELSEEEQQAAARLRKRQQEIQKEQQALMTRVREETARAAEGLEPGSREYREKWSEVFKKHRADYTALSKKRAAVTKELRKLVPGRQRVPYVWLYERL